MLIKGEIRLLFCVNKWCFVTYKQSDDMRDKVQWWVTRLSWDCHKFGFSAFYWLSWQLELCNKGRNLKADTREGFAPGACSRVNLHDQYTQGCILRELASHYSTHQGGNERNFDMRNEMDFWGNLAWVSANTFFITALFPKPLWFLSYNTGLSLYKSITIRELVTLEAGSSFFRPSTCCILSPTLSHPILNFEHEFKSPKELWMNKLANLIG